jgi:hypothetical protein
MTGEPHAESIEFELTPEDLSPQPSSSQQARGEQASSLGAEAGSNVKKHIVRSTGALATLFACVVLRSVAEYDGLIEIQPQATDKPLASPPRLASEKPYEASSPVRMANPFDSSEVFEFPPGTSRAQARESVANLLLQRARERRPQWGAIKRRATQHGSGDTSPS